MKRSKHPGEPVPGLKVVWRVKPGTTPRKARTNWPRLRVINNVLVAFVEGDAFSITTSKPAVS